MTNKAFELIKRSLRTGSPHSTSLEFVHRHMLNKCDECDGFNVYWDCGGTAISDQRLHVQSEELERRICLVDGRRGIDCPVNLYG